MTNHLYILELCELSVMDLVVILLVCQRGNVSSLLYTDEASFATLFSEMRIKRAQNIVAIPRKHFLFFLLLLLFPLRQGLSTEPWLYGNSPSRPGTNSETASAYRVLG